VGRVKDILSDVYGGISSGLSYSGCTALSELSAKARFVRQTSAGATESYTHILLKE